MRAPPFFSPALLLAFLSLGCQASIHEIASGSTTGSGGAGSGGSGGNGGGNAGESGGGTGVSGSGGVPDMGPPPLCGAGASAASAAVPQPQSIVTLKGGLDPGFPALLAVDGLSNVVVVDDADATTDLGGGPIFPIGDDDLVVAKYAPMGDFLWGWRYGSGNVLPTDVAVDIAGHTVVLGTYHGEPLVFGATTLPATGADESDLFVVELDQGGIPIWASRLGGPSFDMAGRLALGPSGTIAVVGLHVDLSSPSKECEILLAELGPAGDVLFQRTFGQNCAQNAVFGPQGAVRFDDHGDIYVTGQGGGDLGNGFVGKGGAFVAKYSGVDGSYLWSRQWATGGAEEETGGVAVLPLGDDIVLAGGFDGDIDLGGGSVQKTCGLTSGGFLARLSGKDGSYQWSRAFASALPLERGALSLDAEGHVVLVAPTQGPTDIGGGPIDPGSDAYMLLEGAYDAGTGAYVSGRPLVAGHGTSSIFSDIFISNGVFDKQGNLVTAVTVDATAEVNGSMITSPDWGTVLLERFAP